MSTSWLGPDLGVPGAIKVYAFPPPAAGAGFFRSWAAVQPREISVRGVRLPQREQRLNEPPYRTMAEAAGAATEALSIEGGGPFAVLGYCAGAWPALATAQLLGDDLVALYLVSYPVPEIEPAVTRLADRLDAAEAAGWLASAGHTDPRILDSPALLRVIEPALRADIALLNGHRPLPRRIAGPIVHIGRTGIAVDQRWAAFSERGLETIELAEVSPDAVVGAMADDLAARVSPNATADLDGEQPSG